jgi:hypothetical protein
MRDPVEPQPNEPDARQVHVRHLPPPVCAVTWRVVPYPFLQLAFLLLLNGVATGRGGNQRADRKRTKLTDSVHSNPTIYKKNAIPPGTSGPDRKKSENDSSQLVATAA